MGVLSGLSADDVISFDLIGINTTAVAISASATQTDLSELANSINRESSKTGVTAELSADKASISLVSATGEDIAITNYSSVTGAQRNQGRLQLLLANVIHGNPAIRELEAREHWIFGTELSMTCEVKNIELRSILNVSREGGFGTSKASCIIDKAIQQFNLFINKRDVFVTEAHQEGSFYFARGFLAQ